MHTQLSYGIEDSDVLRDAIKLAFSYLSRLSSSQLCLDVAVQVLSSLENGNQTRTATGSNTPNLEQLTILILEDALLRSAWQPSGTPPESALITSVMGLLAGLLLLQGTFGVYNSLLTCRQRCSIRHVVVAQWLPSVPLEGTPRRRHFCTSPMRCGSRHLALYSRHTTAKRA